MAEVNPQLSVSDKGKEAEESIGNAQQLNRREFLTYTWGAAMALLMAESGVATYFFLRPRFGAGEFGGEFSLGLADGLPGIGVLPPVVNSAGKFWLIHSEEGVKALYVVCTHLGCLYKWSETNTRFECPCHGSKFTLDGDYIEGPAPRSLDQFEVRVIDNGDVITATEETSESIVPASISNPSTEIVVDTGKRILGKPAEESPARRAV